MPDSPVLDAAPLGLIGGYQGGNAAIKLLIGALVAITLYNGTELTILIFMTFRRYRGLYFWSLLLSTVLGLLPTGIGNILHFFAIGPLPLSLAISNFAYYFLVPGQSVVLYSRLHLVLHNERILRLVLFVAAIAVVIVAVPTTITTMGSAFVRTNSWSEAYKIMERTQVTWFCVQETLISILYIRETVKLLNLSIESPSQRKMVMYELVAINILIIAMDIVVLVIEYLGIYYLQVLLKATIYSIKLKLEFAVLGKLTDIVHFRQHELTGIADSSYFTRK